MKKKMYTCLSLAAVTALCGCAGVAGTPQPAPVPDTSAAASQTVRARSNAAADPALAAIIPKETVTLDVYSQLSGYSGEQGGWFAQILLDKFNVKLNFIYDGSEGFYEQLSAGGDLGDLILWGSDSDQYQSALGKGLLLDWEKDGLLDTYGTYIKEHMPKALEKNKNNSGGHLYGFGHNVAAAAGEYGDFDYHPDIRWDLYEQLGKPEVNEIEDYVSVLKQMKELCPTSDSGRETYGVSLFSDWDGDMMMFAKSTCTNFFGVDEFGIGLYEVNNGRFHGCLEKGGYYERVLRFYNALYRNDLLNPDSRTHGYEGCVRDYQDGAAFFCIFGWLAAPQYNSVKHLADGKMMLPLAAKNQNTLVYGLTEYGESRLWTIGSKTEHPALAMALVNWLCTPEGRLIQEYGPKGVGWDYDLDKNTCLIALPSDEAGSDRIMPASSGYSGTWSEGVPQFNNTTWTKNTINPDANGQTYNSSTWPNVTNEEAFAIEERWRTDNNAANAREYLSRFQYAISKPNTYTASSKPEELGTKWASVTEIIRDGSWNAVYAKDDSTFDRILNTMYTQANEAGYEDCVLWCEEEAAKRRASERDSQ